MKITPHYNKMTQKEISIQNQNEIKILTDKIIIFESEIKNISKGVDKILFHLNSDKDTNSEGLIERTNRLSGELEAVKSKVQEAKIIAATVSFIIGVMFTIFKFIFK